ncbi:hypothetical protein MSAN_00276700 [Mycena sanguinolenta]|uniref:GH18 domain-containing protein n=1 Tax=Mycena sanguinolenta TaxID=230812 RepID=A0A8H7DN53_9AGAR|nr:hypothetical protein MSAN_00276700 [Mycena sanguinolenta]
MGLVAMDRAVSVDLGQISVVLMSALHGVWAVCSCIKPDLPFERLVGRCLLRRDLPNLSLPAVLNSDFAEPPPISVVMAAKVIAGPRSNLPAVWINPRLPVDGSGTMKDGPHTGWTVRSRLRYTNASGPSSCMAFPPESIPADSLTHINFAFALISSSYEIIEMTAGDSDLWKRTTALKENLPALKVFLSIGGWTFNDPPTQSIFSNMVASEANTNAFLSSALSIMEQYAFDGLDIDWEYPGASDRGGVPADTENYVKFMATVKAAFKAKKLRANFVMTYDLHGVWDGTDVGQTLDTLFWLTQTAMTEIEAAFDLYWRVNVDPSQVVMGFAFYGRSYTLSTSDCSDPGCPWSSGAPAGPCSNNVGSLMWAEINAIVGPDLQAVIQTDEVAAVNYAVFGTDLNLWVSYDDVITFGLKMTYANDHCIGGSMIWSVDQDDDIFRQSYFFLFFSGGSLGNSRMNSLYPDIVAAESGDGEQQNDGSCFVTDCGAQSCFSDVTEAPNTIHAAYIVGDVYYNPIKGNCDLKESDQAQVCCPTNMGGSCVKRGYKDATTPCSPACQIEEILVAMDIVGDNLNEKCSSGTTALCCDGGVTVAPADCIFTECSSDPRNSCPSSAPNFQTSVSTGAGACLDGTSHGFCCEKPFPWTNCAWQGTPPLCGDNSCQIGQITVFQDPLGDGTSPCTGGNVRSYCCDVPQALPVPFSDVFPSTVTDTGNDLFNVDFDPDEGDSFSEEGTTSTFTEDDNENNSAFGEVFIDSPNPSSVSSLDVTADWVLSGCDAKSDQAQTVVAHCSADSDACQHVFIGGAANTIVKLPLSCGLGPYARVVSLEPHANQSVLAKYRRTASGTVYSLSFDYNFAAIPAENGPVYMRADVTDMPGYWDSVVDSPPERREWLKSRGLWKEPPKKRWWGAFTNWLSKLNQIESDNSQSRTFFWSDTWTIFHQDLHCDGPPEFDASLDISVNGQTQLTTRYGFYLQGQIVPPQVTAAYVYFNAGGKAAATFTMTGTASVTWNSDTVQFASFGFPGLYYPGLLTIGPSLVLNGYITGELSLTGTLTTGLTYQFPDINYALGKSGNDDTGSKVTPSTPDQGYKYSFGYNVDLSGSLNIHVVPTVQLGISVLGGSLIDANAYVAADLYAGVEITGSVSNAQALEVCINPHYGLILSGGVTGSLLYWESSPLEIEFFSTDYTFMSKASMDRVQDSKRGLGALSASAGTPPSFAPTHPEPRIMVEDKDGHSEVLPLSRTIEKRALIPPLVGTDFLCPQTDSSIGEENYDNDIYSDAEPLSNDDDGVFRRDTFPDIVERGDPAFVFNSSDNQVLVKVASCGNLIRFDGFAYTNTNPTGYWNLASPTILDYRFAPYPNQAAGVITYLESGVVADEFVRAHQCMTGVWTAWYNAYLNDNTVDAPQRSQYTLPLQYRLWLISTVQGAASALESGIQNMITWYETSAGGTNNAEMVDLNWGRLAAQGNSLVSGQDLRNAILAPVSDTDFYDAIVSRL